MDEATSLPSGIKVWVKSAGNYVSGHGTGILRIKHTSMINRNRIGQAIAHGEFTGMPLSSLKAFHPVILEICGECNPLSTLISRIRDTGGEESLKELLSGVRLLSLDDADCSCESLEAVLRAACLLSAVSFNSVSFSDDEWLRILDLLSALSIRSLSISSGPVEPLVNRLNLELLHFSGQPGISISEVEKASPFVTVRFLVLQDLKVASNTSFEHFLSAIPELFPRLEGLFIDWKVVDNVLEVNTQSKRIVQTIVGFRERIDLKMLGILAYTPCTETQNAAAELARLLSSRFESTSLARFGSPSLPSGQHNFSLISGGTNGEGREVLTKMIVERRSSLFGVDKSILFLQADSPLPLSGTLIEIDGSS